MNEWILYASFADEQPGVPEAEVLDTLTHIWVTSIYRAPV
jgi:TetR/AcrR family transcriptional regulator, ethionamide resistance regulator